MRVNIELEAGESIDQAEGRLLKALSSQQDGTAHASDVFLDPAIAHQADVMKRVYKQIFANMLDEISEVLETQ